MKKFVLLLLSIFLFIQPTLACNVQKTLDLQKGSEPQANKVLYEYILDSLKMTPEQVKEFANIDLESIKAYEVDLNADGENEVIGVCYSTLYWGTAGYHLFVLYKNSGQYEDISLIVFEPQTNVVILQDKDNNFSRIRLIGSKGWQYVAKFVDNMYQWSHRE